MQWQRNGHNIRFRECYCFIAVIVVILLLAIQIGVMMMQAEVNVAICRMLQGLVEECGNLWARNVISISTILIIVIIIAITIIVITFANSDVGVMRRCAR